MEPIIFDLNRHDFNVINKSLTDSIRCLWNHQDVNGICKMSMESTRFHKNMQEFVMESQRFSYNQYDFNLIFVIFIRSNII